MSSRRRVRIHRRDDRGIAVVFFAVSVTAMLAVAALVLGGSVGYTAVRNAQTAADSAALAGASELRGRMSDLRAISQGELADGPANHLLGEIAEDLFEDVESVVEDNGGQLDSEGCVVVSAAYGVTNAEGDTLGRCDDLVSLTNAELATVAGVRVAVDDERDVPFSAFVDQETITGTAVAAATVQPLVDGRAPFMVCTAPGSGHPAQILLPDPAAPMNYTMNPDAVGLSYVLWGNPMKDGNRNCGAGSQNWRGLVNFERSYPVPSPDPSDQTDWWEIGSGNKTGQVGGLLGGSGGACDVTTESNGDVELGVGCRLALPLCPKSNHGTGIGLRLYCLKLGAFEITWTDGSAGVPPCLNEDDKTKGKIKVVCGTYLGPAVAASGQGGAEVPDPDSVVVIKLVE